MRGRGPTHTSDRDRSGRREHPSPPGGIRVGSRFAPARSIDTDLGSTPGGVVGSTTTADLAAVPDVHVTCIKDQRGRLARRSKPGRICRTDNARPRPAGGGPDVGGLADRGGNPSGTWRQVHIALSTGQPSFTICSTPGGVFVGFTGGSSGPRRHAPSAQRPGASSSGSRR
jgi:hypothetical protein